MHPDRIRYDVVVVGARAAGAATAMLLARDGLRVLVVDRSRYGADTLSTHALMRGGVLQLQRWGVLDRVVATGTPAIRRTSFHFADEEIVISIKPSHGVDALYAPRRTVLDPILVDGALEAGAEVRYGVAVTDVRRDGHGRVIGIEGRDGAGRSVVVDAGIVIGADGLRSTVADRVGAPIEHGGTAGGAVVYGYWSGMESDGYDWAFRSGLAGGLIPTNDGLACVFASGPAARIGRGGQKVLEDVLGRAAPGLAARVAAGRAPRGVRTFAGVTGYLRRAWGPGWALVGDAGSWKDPISAHGLTDALRDAELLARAVVSGGGDEAAEGEALAGYQAVRDRLSLPLLTTSDAIGSYGWSDSEIGPLLLQLSSAMAEEVDAIAGLDTRDPLPVA
jgi:2-polyprenyl-6-methoxyphenol hydroxylase-like FAD-dependent oxidoreductase